ncbi:MAG: hypothetical protein P8I99_15120 [Acidimicrobiales bacterium]|nr:hypothetical protein [Acidimicrobiales bacterium]
MTDRPPEPEDPGLWTRLDAVVAPPETANAPRRAEFEVGQLIPDDPEPSIAAAALGLGAAPNTVTVSRRALMVGAGVAGLVIVVLFFLWRSAGGDDDSTAASGDDTAEMADRDADADESSAAGVDDAGVSATEDELAVLGGRIGELEAELAAMRPPALAGSAMRRIVVATDASFVSLGNQGLAVIGPFGGYAAVDPATNAVTATAQVASGATRVMRTESAVWITNATGNQIVRVDAVANAVRSVFDFPSPDGIAKLGPTLVVASFDGGFVAQVDPANGEVLNELDVLGEPGDVWVNDSEDWIWVALVDSGEVVKIDAETLEIADRVTVGAGPSGLTGDDGILWVANDIEGTVVGVDMDSVEVVASIAVGDSPTAAAIYENDLWVSVTGAGELVQIDRETGEVITRTPLGSSNRGGPGGMTAGSGSLWVAMQGERSVVRITIGE